MSTKILGICLLGALFGTTACSGEPAPPPVTSTTTVTVSPTVAVPAEPDARTVAWFDGLCGAVHGYRIANNKALEGRESGTVVTKKYLNEELPRLAELAGRTVDQLSALGASPVPNGDEVKKSLLDKFTASRDAAAEGKKKLDAGGSVETVSKATMAAQKHIQDTTDPLKGFKLESQELVRAVASAKSCRPES